MEAYLKVIDFIMQIIEHKKINDEKFYNEYVEITFNDAKKIYEDLTNILGHVEQEFSDKHLSVQEAISYIKNSRIPFKAARRDLHSKLIVTIFNSKEEEDMYMFAIGVRGVLQGGMSGEYADRISIISNSYYKRFEKGEGLLLYQGKHTLADLVERFDKDNIFSIYYEKTDKYCGCKEEYINKEFKNAITRQIISIDEYWKLTTIAYQKIKHDRLS